MGIYAAVLQALGLLEGLGMVADPSRDDAGLALASAALPNVPARVVLEGLEMPPDIEVFIDILAGLKRVGTLRRQPRPRS